MSRYAHIDELKNALQGISLDAWSTTAHGSDSTRIDDALEQFLLAGDSWVDNETQRVFTPLAQWMDILSGSGGSALTLPRSPVVDVQRVQMTTAPLMPSVTIPTSALRLDRRSGRMSILPGLQLASALPQASQGFPVWSFPSGSNNVVAQYRTGFAVVGGNLSMDALMADPWPAVASITTDATYATFSLPEPFARFRAGETIASRSAGAMLKDGSDDSSTWTMVSSRSVRCPIASYSAAAKYVFVYVPAAIEQAVLAKAVADVLRDKGAKDATGAGGAISISAGPFKEDYGELPYAGQIKRLEDDAKGYIRPYRAALVAIA